MGTVAHKARTVGGKMAGVSIYSCAFAGRFHKAFVVLRRTPALLRNSFAGRRPDVLHQSIAKKQPGLLELTD